MPLRDTLVTDAGRQLDVGSLVPIQKGRKLVEQEIFAEAAEKVRVFGIELLEGLIPLNFGLRNMVTCGAPWHKNR